MYSYGICSDGDNITITPMKGDSIELHGGTEIALFINRLLDCYLKGPISQSSDFEKDFLDGDYADRFFVKIKLNEKELEDLMQK